MYKNKKNILKNNPFGFKSSKELFDKIIRKKYDNLNQTNSLEEFYDFIFICGALRDWIQNEFKLTDQKYKDTFLNDKYFSIFHSIYNNSKHFKLENAQEYFIVLDGDSIMPTNVAGECIFTDDFIIKDDSYFLDRISGDKGNSSFFCTVKEKRTNNKENIYLYEICKIIYEKYEKLLKQLP